MKPLTVKKAFIGIDNGKEIQRYPLVSSKKVRTWLAAIRDTKNEMMS